MVSKKKAKKGKNPLGVIFAEEKGKGRRQIKAIQSRGMCIGQEDKN